MTIIRARSAGAARAEGVRAPVRGVEERHGFAGALPSVGGHGGPFEAPHVSRP
jgi:hypothetical protein